MRIGVIMGGISTEREISLYTGKEMLYNLDEKKYEIYPITIDNKRDIFNKTQNIDFALLALHGKFGEDGTIQAILETLNIPYSGCGILSSALCMDKAMTKKILSSDGIKVPHDVVIQKFNDNIIDEFEYPVILKPVDGGSSIGVQLIETKNEIKKTIENSLKFNSEIMLEEYINGDEITCCILNGELLPIMSSKHGQKFLDYNSKYFDKCAKEYIVELDKELYKKVNDVCSKTWNLLKCSVYARIDIIIKNGEPYVIEVNTLPGMTKNSFFPKSAAAAGINFSTLLDLIIESSIYYRDMKIKKICSYNL
jgi:D-alanine-D-alanine ligase